MLYSSMYLVDTSDKAEMKKEEAVRKDIILALFSQYCSSKSNIEQNFDIHAKPLLRETQKN